MTLETTYLISGRSQEEGIFKAKSLYLWLILWVEEILHQLIGLSKVVQDFFHPQYIYLVAHPT
jgi:hypothetical protein